MNNFSNNILASYATRLRRNRKNIAIRSLVRETSLSVDDLVYPVFILDGKNRREPIKSMPDQYRVSIDELLKVAKDCMDLGIKAIALFPVIETSKTLMAEESYNPDGLVPRAIRALKLEYPQLLIFSDIALDPYTIHGQDGIIDDDNYVLNDITVNILCKQAICHAIAGVDFVSPSDMMDGRIGAIRRSLDESGFVNTGIMAYSAKYASKFYGPFRDAVGSSINLGGADKHSYQMDPANSMEALHEAKIDINEGADIVMVKPGIPYLDVLYRIKSQLQKPTAVYHVSGEYAMLKATELMGMLDYKTTIIETMTCFKRAGADIIWTYSAIDVARLLKS